MTYLDTASFGFPPRRVADAVRADLERWATGTARARAYDGPVDAARASFARLMNVPLDSVAIGGHVSTMIGLTASALQPGDRVLCAEEDFTSVLFPFLARAGLDVALVPLDELAEHVDGQTKMVAVSAVQSADGRVADLDAIADAAQHHGALTVIDATQAAGWLPLDASRFDALITSSYKWLVSPRGAALMTIKPELVERIAPTGAGWYAGDDRWDALYGGPLRLARTARRLDLSPAWSAFVGLAEALALFEERTIDAVNEHDVGLANALRGQLGLEPTNSAIVSLAVGDDAAERLAERDITASLRAGRLRLSFHLHNDENDVDRVAEALAAVRC